MRNTTRIGTLPTAVAIAAATVTFYAPAGAAATVGEQLSLAGNVAAEYANNLAVARSGTGSFVVSYTRNSAIGTSRYKYARLFNADGTPDGDAFVIDAGNDGRGAVTNPLDPLVNSIGTAAAVDPNGTLVTVWNAFSVAVDSNGAFTDWAGFDVGRIVQH